MSFENPQNIDSFGATEIKLSVHVYFCQAYGIDESDVRRMRSVIINRLLSLIDFMTLSRQNGDRVCKINIEAGRYHSYVADIKYIKANQEHIKNELVK